MKKMTRLLALILAFAMLSTVVVGAAEAKPQGVYITSVATGYELTALAANTDPDSDEKFMPPSTRVENGETIYENTIAFELSFTGAKDVQYVVFLLNGKATSADEPIRPGQSNIRYIDQEGGTGAKLTFVPYPDDITEPGDYSVYLSSSEDEGTYTEVATFTVTAKPGLKGDVNLDGKVTVDDAILLLKHIAKITNITDELALYNAEVTGNTSLSVSDATKILKYVAKIIGSLD